jgi:hypothetical protein
MKETIYARLNSYVMERTIMEPDSECLTWVGRLRLKEGSSKHTPVMKTTQTKRTWLSVPRYTWGLFRPELSKHDRLRNACGNRACINPYHYENISEVCPEGHKRTPETFYLKKRRRLDPDGQTLVYLEQNCRPCNRLESLERHRAKRKAAK